MTRNLTGPELFALSRQEYAEAFEVKNDTGAQMISLMSALVTAVHAQTAAIVMQTEEMATPTGTDNGDLDAWHMVLPPEAPWTTVTFEVDGETVKDGEPGELWEASYRVPANLATDSPNMSEATAEQYSRPVFRRVARRPEPKHELLPVGTRVLVSERKYADEDYPQQPYVGIVKGYDLSRSKYQIRPEIFSEPGTYFEHVRWAFADNRVERHPEQNPTPPAPEPKPLVLYVQRFTGKQGRVLEMGSEKGKVRVKVQWFAPGAEPVWIDLDVLKIIPAEEVDRCPNGQTGDECGSGENQCELCLQDEDAEGDAIEESMGLR